MNIIRTINLNERARKASHAGFKDKAWREYGLGEDGKLYMRGPTSGYGYQEWTPIVSAGIALDKKLLAEMAKAFLDKKTLAKILTEI